jgi:signal transduction histidine kinase
LCSVTGNHGPVTAPKTSFAGEPGASSPTAGTGTATPRVASATADITSRRFLRSADDQVLGGVASGLADHMGVPVRWVRIAFIAFNAGSGFGLLLYAAFWIIVPVGDASPLGSQRKRMGEVKRQLLRFFFAVAVVAALAGNLADWIPTGRFFIPTALSMLGAAFIWRQATDAQRTQWRRMSKSSLLAGADDRVGLGRLAFGVVLVIAGVVVVVAGSGLSAMRDGLVAAVATITGVALITGPWWIRLVSDLSTERRVRIRTQERADIAAHLHDSVLQTLALIQRNSDNPREIVRLARGQERELRTLLYGEQQGADHLAAALAATLADVENQYAVAIEQVVVGDAPMDPGLNALVQATREALTNAAKHAMVQTISLYVEVEAGEVAVYVRDRGVGFEEGSVADDRQGLRGSIRGRIERHGGIAVVRTGLGRGTEVELRMPRGLQ